MPHPDNCHTTTVIDHLAVRDLDIREIISVKKHTGKHCERHKYSLLFAVDFDSLINIVGVFISDHDMTALALYFIGRYSLPIKRICHLNINGQRFVGRTLAIDVLAVGAPRLLHVARRSMSVSFRRP